MPDLSDQILPQLRSHRQVGLELGRGAVHPHYEGGSILNLPSGICRLLDIPPLSSAPVTDSILGPFYDSDNVRRVVMIFVDALSLNRLRRWMTNGTTPIWNDLAGRGILAPLTSVVPSTTSACLPSFWSGLSPAAHGLVGYELWLKEYGVVANMIRHKTFHMKDSDGTLETAGFKPESYLPGKTLGTQLLENHIPAWAFQPDPIVRSGLSRMMLKDTNIHPYSTSADLFISLRDLLESDPSEKMFAWAYWAQLDYTSHNYGPDHPRSTAEFASFSTNFEQLFLNELSVEARKGTVLMLAADHGQINTQQDPHYDLKNHPGLVRRLHMMPTGENRLTYFYIRPGQTEAVDEYLAKRFMNEFITLEPGYTVEAGLFGPGPLHPRLLERLGDMIAVAGREAYLWWSPKPNPIFGRHGGLSEDEMLVPLLAVRLD